MYQDKESELQDKIGFCTCGRREQNLEYVLKGLLIIGELAFVYEPLSVVTLSDWNSVRDSHFGNEAAAYFFFYWAASKGYTEHGGSVPGWLTAEEEDLIKELKDWSSYRNYE